MATSMLVMDVRDGLCKHKLFMLVNFEIDRCDLNPDKK